MQPTKLLQDILILGPFVLTVSAGLVILIRSRHRSRLAATLGGLGLVGLTARAAYNYYAGVPVARWLQAQVVDPSVASLLLQSLDGLLIGVCALLLVSGVVVGRNESPAAATPSGDDD